MSIDIKKNIEEIKEAINSNKMINVQMEQLDHEYDINIEHIHYLSEDIAKELKSKSKDIINVEIKKDSVKIRMKAQTNLECIKQIGYAFDINNKDITVNSVCENEVLYIDMIIKI